MAVAYNQLDEVLGLFQRYIMYPEKVLELLRALREVRAYRANKSYRETIDRLLQRAKERGV